MLAVARTPIEIHGHNAKEICKLIVFHGRNLKDGDKIEILFHGLFSGHVTVRREDRDTLLLTGALGSGLKGRLKCSLYGDLIGSEPEGTVSDLYEGGCRFSVDKQPRVKLGKPPTREHLALKANARDEMIKWLTGKDDLTEDDRRMFRRRAAA